MSHVFRYETESLYGPAQESLILDVEFTVDSDGAPEYIGVYSIDDLGRDIPGFEFNSLTPRDLIKLSVALADEIHRRDLHRQPPSRPGDNDREDRDR